MSADLAAILLEERPAEGVALLRLNRPEVFNALNLALRRALAEAFRRLDLDPSVRVIVLAGGSKAFCAGADLNEYVDATPVDLLQRRHDLLWGAIAACSNGCTTCRASRPCPASNRTTPSAAAKATTKSLRTRRSQPM